MKQLSLEFETCCTNHCAQPPPDRHTHRLERHHRRARSLGGGNNFENIALVDAHLHDAYHLLFGPGDPSNIVALLNNQYGPPDVMFFWVPHSRNGLRQICNELNRISKHSRYEVFMRRKHVRRGKLPRDKKKGSHT